MEYENFSKNFNGLCEFLPSVSLSELCGFLATFGDRLKRNTVCRSYTPPQGRQALLSRQGLPHVHTVSPHAAWGGARGYAASAWACAGPSRGAPTKRRLRRSRRARPNIWRLSILRRLICPSTGPVDQGKVTPALTAS